MFRVRLLSVLLLPVLALADEEPKKPKWDVEKPTGPTAQVKIDTSEGTWMSVDVSPDGKTLVFDLLGDLYTLPITGGEARAITSGAAWDAQPRFSPDGKRLAFVSDRGGGDNVWVMPVGGGEAKAVTSETFKMVYSPAWSPDGQYLVARKHITAERSLGSGELWLYHLGGGKGVQLLDKPNKEKDLGEPAFSPDGRYIYYSQDVTGGGTFQYNKDPYAGIYAVKRLDRRDGFVETVVGGPGGAVRPTPSPDGKRLAFIRRDGTHTVLTVRELGSGVEKALDDGLDRDLQETWAVHGVYPAMAWTPDGKEVVYWAGGGLRRVELASGKPSAIPFHVSGERTVVQALRTPIEVAPKTFHTRALRGVDVAPDGKTVAYDALGHAWLKDLPAGKPRRLTSDEDVFEHSPSFSRDGKSVVYVAWSDTALGSVRVAGRAGGKGKTITRQPGHFVGPVFSPDGKTVVVSRVEGGELVSPLWSEQPGLYSIPAAGGDATLVSRSGFGAHFGAASDRVFFLDSEKKGDDEKTILRSVSLTRAEPRTDARGDLTQEMRVSPDGKWLAFVEGFQVYVTPMPASPKPLEIGPKAEGLPVAHVSKDSGAYLTWSGDSRALRWSLGPTLYTRELNDAFAFLTGVDKLPEKPVPEVDMGFDAPADAPTGTIALVGARLVTMKGDEVISDGAILVEGNRITAVGPRASVKVPAGARTIDVAGTTILPGLVDVHAHGSQATSGQVPQVSWLNAAELAYGVTTLHDPSNDTADFFAASELVRAGAVVGPRLFSTGTILYGARGTYKASVDSLDDARAHLRRQKAWGAFSVKSYNQPRREQRQQILAAARELGMMVVPEGGSLLDANLSEVVDGHTGIEHSVPVAHVYKDVTQLWGGTAVGYTPTLIVAYGGLFGEEYWYAHERVYEERLRAFLPPRLLEVRARRRLLASDDDWNHIEAARNAKRLLDAGVSVQLGAHGQREGLGAHWELAMFVQGGMTPHQALRAGTLAGARYLGLDKDLGSIEPGKLADLVVINGDVLGDINQSRNIKYTMANGRLYDVSTMDEIAPRARKRLPFWWEMTKI